MTKTWNLEITTYAPGDNGLYEAVAVLYPSEWRAIRGSYADARGAYTRRMWSHDPAIARRQAEDAINIVANTRGLTIAPAAAPKRTLADRLRAAWQAFNA